MKRPLRPRAQRRRTMRIWWPAPDGWGPVVNALGPLPIEAQQRLAVRLAGALSLNTRAGFSSEDTKAIRAVAQYALKRLANIDDKRVQGILAALSRLAVPTPKPKEEHTVVLEALFDTYVITRLEHPRSGSVGFDEALRSFLEAALDLTGLGSMYSEGCLINEDEARGVWNRWLRTHRRPFLSLK